jgi:hypothetical protein
MKFRRHLIFLPVMCLVLLALAAGSLGTSEGSAATARPTVSLARCAASEKTTRQAAVVAYQKRILSDRRAFFRTHKSAKSRAAFVKRQQARLKALKTAAACTVAVPKFAFVSATLQARTVTLTFTSLVKTAAPADAFTVLADGLRYPVSNVQASGASVVLTVLYDIPAGRTVTVDYLPPPAGGIADAHGQRSSALTRRAVTNNSSTPPPSSAGGSFSPSLAAPSFATDTRATSPNLQSPHVGEWTFPLRQFYLPATGTLHGIAIFVDFPDAKLNTDPQTYLDEYVPRAQAWFREVSNGRFALTVDRAPHTYSLPKTIADYTLDRCCNYPSMREAFSDAVRLADPDVNFAQYDAVWVFGAAGRMTYLLWRPLPGEGVVADGKEIRLGVVGGVDPHDYRSRDNLLSADQALVRVSHDVFTHEIGHMLGLQDLYTKQPDFSNTWENVGGWDIMSETTPAAHYLVWNKWLLGWVEAAQLRGLTAPGVIEQTIAPTETGDGVKAIVVPTSATSTYVVEVRAKLGMDGLLCDEGVLVYTVDSTKMNASGSIDIKAARGDADPFCGQKAFAAWGAGQTYEDATVRVEVLAANPDGSYNIRVTRK